MSKDIETTPPRTRRRVTNRLTTRRRRPAAPESESVRRFAARYPFQLDEFQLQALRALDAGQSVLAAAPTGTGKTVLAEYGIHLAREQGLRAIYTAPIKALSNQKFRDWRAIYGDEVGLLTGDVTENPDGSIMVMTTEVLRNMLLQSTHALDGVGCVIFDEVHFLADPDRGTTWEEAILYCPKHVQLVCLSATVANADEIAAWISLVHREIALVSHVERAIPLEHYYFLEGELHLLVDAQRNVSAPLRVGGEARYPRPPGVPPRARPREVPRPREVVHFLDGEGMLPAIYFLFGRRACELAAEDCGALDLIPSRAARRARRERIEAYLSLLDEEDRQLAQVQRLSALLIRGVAYHHAGLLPILKALVEELFAAGLIGVVFATETLALGINMPARSVVIAEQTKFDGESRRPLMPNEYAQLVGRAGRRGLDPKGYAVTLYSPWVSCAEVVELITGELLPIRSAFTPRYNTVASVWDGSLAGRDRLVRLFSSSLRQFQMNDELKAVAAEVERRRARVESLHFTCPYDGVADNAVVEYIGLRRAQSEARKRTQRAEAAAAVVRRQLLRPPWPAPAPDMVRREMRTFAGGELLYLSGNRESAPDADEVSGADLLDAVRPGSWGVFLGRHGTGPGLFLVGHRVEAIKHWAAITRLPEGKPAIDLPDGLREIEGPMEDVRPLLGPRGWRSLQAAIRRLDLPDLPAAEMSRLEAARRELAQVLDAAGQREQRAVHDLADLERAIEGHPCHACPIRSEHEHALRHQTAAVRELGEAEAHAAELEAAAASQAERTLEALTGVMARFGFLAPPPPAERRAPRPPGGVQASVRQATTALDQPHPAATEEDILRPTEKTAVLARIYDPNGVMLCNLLWDGAFDQLAPAELMEVLSWFSYDREGPRWNRNQLTPRLWDLRPRVGEALTTVQRAEAEAGLAITTGPNPDFYGPVLAWCRGTPFADLLERLPISEGDLLLALNKTLDLATQLREALRLGAPADLVARRIAAKLEVGDGLLRRGIVAQSLRLATGLPSSS
ncbi:MAG TPA: DEAD/DEAH box helicase [Chloroflexota bacterium]|nr:DEAD/DEAH box helicase [Chloroflexota bacterium]